MANDGAQNYLYRSDRKGQFKEIGFEAGVALDDYLNGKLTLVLITSIGLPRVMCSGADIYGSVIGRVADSTGSDRAYKPSHKKVTRKNGAVN